MTNSKLVLILQGQTQLETYDLNEKMCFPDIIEVNPEVSGSIPGAVTFSE
jgi:hypothetical protein